MIKIKIKAPNPAEKPKIKYPYIGVSVFNGNIVLFTEPGKGTVLSCDETESYVGYMTDNWDEHNYELFNGSITLSND
jgi:hypothetical protein